MQGYAVNVPLCDGLDDNMFFETAFIPVMEQVMYRFQPTVVVLQSGADSVASDKIGKFNLTTPGHASAGRWLRNTYPNIPVMVLGGGGYTISNVARTWSYETISMLGYQDSDIPYMVPMVRFFLALSGQCKVCPAAVIARCCVQHSDHPHATWPAVQDAYHWEHIKQELRYEPGAVPWRVGSVSEMTNRNTPTRVSKIVANIIMNLKEFVRPVSVPFEEVQADAVADPADMDAEMHEGDREGARDL